MKNKIIFYGFCFLLALSVPLRVFELYRFVDPSTGFLKQGALSLTALLGIISVVMALAFLFPLKNNKNFRQLYLPTIPTGLAYVVCGLVLLFYSIYDVSAALTPGKYDFILLVACAFGLAAAVFLILFGKSFFTPDTSKNWTYITLLPSLWAIFFLVAMFISFRSIANQYYYLFSLLSMVCLVPVLFFQAKLLVRLTVKKSLRWLMFFAFPMTYFGVSNSLPQMILKVLGKNELLSVLPPADYLSLAFAFLSFSLIFAIVFSPKALERQASVQTDLAQEASEK